MSFDYLMSTKSTKYISKDTERAKTGMAETKTSTASSSSPSHVRFYGDTFSRPTTTTISLDLFKTSTTAMLHGISRNPFAHWNSSDSTLRPICKHEFSRHKFAFCADCKQQCISLQQIAKEEDWSRKIQEEDASKSEHLSMLHALGVTIEWLLAFTFDHNCWDKPTWWVNRHIIKEATRHNRRRVRKMYTRYRINIHQNLSGNQSFLFTQIQTLYIHTILVVIFAV